MDGWMEKTNHYVCRYFFKIQLENVWNVTGKCSSWRCIGGSMAGASAAAKVWWAHRRMRLLNTQYGRHSPPIESHCNDELLIILPNQTWNHEYTSANAHELAWKFVQEFVFTRYLRDQQQVSSTIIMYANGKLKKIRGKLSKILIICSLVLTLEPVPLKAVDSEFVLRDFDQHQHRGSLMIYGSRLKWWQVDAPRPWASRLPVPIEQSQFHSCRITVSEVQDQKNSTFFPHQNHGPCLFWVDSVYDQ